MKRTQYPIHNDFKRWARMNPPLNRTLVPLIQRLMGVLFKLQRSSAAVEVQRLKIPVKDGAEISVLQYSPACAPAGEVLPCLMYFHGGGYVFPAAPYQYNLAREYAEALNCKVLFVNYRLAPEHPFPAAPEDCYAAYCWTIEHAAELGVDKERMAVIGDSAGGCLATVICLMARERGQIVPRSQVLTYPAVGLSLETESMKQFTDTPMCNSADAQIYSALYIQNSDSGKSEYHSPISADDLSGLPAAYIETAEYDCLRDGGIMYAERLESFDVPVELHKTKGTIHGFDIVLDSPIVRDCVARRIAFIRSHWKRD